MGLFKTHNQMKPGFTNRLQAPPVAGRTVPRTPPILDPRMFAYAGFISLFAAIAGMLLGRHGLTTVAFASFGLVAARFGRAEFKKDLLVYLREAARIDGREVARRADPQRAKPQRAEPQRAEPQRAEPQRAEPQRAEPQRAEPKRAEPKRAELKRAELKRAEPKRAEPKRAEPKRAEPKRAEPKRAEPQVVRGEAGRRTRRQPTAQDPTTRRPGPRRAAPGARAVGSRSQRVVVPARPERSAPERLHSSARHQIPSSADDVRCPRCGDVALQMSENGYFSEGCALAFQIRK